MAQTKHNAALWYSTQGWNVIPLHWVDSDDEDQPICSCGKADCPRPGKHPLLSNGVRAASRDPGQVRAWWKQWPEANIGIATGLVSGIAVLDLDGEEAETTLKEGELCVPDNGPIVSTGKGRHIYMMCPDEGVPNFVKRLPGIDFRGDGGYVIAPPSNHISGRVYKWAQNPDKPLPEVPQWILDLIEEQRTERAGKLPDKIGDGERNDTLARLGGYLRRKGMSPDAIFAALKVENAERCDPPLPEEDVETIARSVGRYKPAVEEVEVEIPADKGDDGQGGGGQPPKKGKLPTIAAMPGGNDERLTDLGNAKRFLREFGEDLYYLPDWGKWAIWDGKQWKQDKNDRILALGLKLSDVILRDAALEPNRNLKLLLVKHALQTEAISKVRAFLTAGQSFKAKQLDEFDQQPHLLNCPNGVVDLRSGMMLDHSRDLMMTKMASVDYNPEADCPKFKKFLYEIMGGNEELVNWIQKALGYAMTGDTREQCFFIMYGVGANGKSTLLEIVKHIMGDYGRTSNFSAFADKPASNGPSEDIARLAGARMVTATESNAGLSFQEALIKQLTGTDKVSARFLYRESFEFDPSFKIFFSTNHKPGIKAGSEGIWRRIRMIPFRIVIPEDKRDQGLQARLIDEESEGILAWLVEGAVRWYAEGLNMPQEVRQETQNYRTEMDTFQTFLEDACELDDEGKVKFNDLYESYQVWCETNGEKALSGKWFGLRLTERGYEQVRSNGASYRQGLKLREDAPKKRERGGGDDLTPFGTMIE